MSEINVRIVKLEPMKVACASGFGTGPENQAWDRLKAWMQRKGLANDLKSRRFFGFNNPNPSPGSPNYGYDQWVTVGPEVTADAEDRSGGVRILDFPGGLYAVTRVKFGGDPGVEFPQAWQQLALWRESSRYRSGSHQCLEEAIVGADGQIALNEFDLCLPIAE
jgi:DNA gyrase inhibitor GyrI